MLGLLVASVYLYQLGKPVIYTVAPMLVMIVSVSWAMTVKLNEFYHGWRTRGDTTNLSLLIIGSVLAIMSLWMMMEAVGAYRRARRHRLTQMESAAVVQRASVE